MGKDWKPKNFQEVRRRPIVKEEVVQSKGESKQQGPRININ